MFSLPGDCRSRAHGGISSRCPAAHRMCWRCAGTVTCGLTATIPRDFAAPMRGKMSCMCRLSARIRWDCVRMGACCMPARRMRETGRVADWAHIRLLRGSDTLTLGVAQDGSICFCGKHSALDAARRRADSDRLPSDAGALFAGWDALRDVVISEHIIAGLRADGTVVAMSEDGSVEPAVADWRDIRAIAAGCAHLVGLEFGGRCCCRRGCPRTVRCLGLAADCGCFLRRRLYGGAVRRRTAVAAGQVYVGSVSPDNPDGWVGCAVGGWSHLLAVCCGHNHIAAMTDSGRFSTCGQDVDGQCRGRCPLPHSVTCVSMTAILYLITRRGEESRNSVSKPPERRRTDTRTAFSRKHTAGSAMRRFCGTKPSDLHPAFGRTRLR